MSKNLMLCGSVDSLEGVNLDLYIAEEKYDGERIMILKKGDSVTMLNRRGVEKSNIYIEIKEELKDMPFDFFIDGEMCSTNGVFNDLQRRALLRDGEEIQIRRHTIPVVYHIFDIISLGSKVLSSLPLMERKKELGIFDNRFVNVKVAPWVEGADKIKEIWANAKELNKEGIVLKVKTSRYYYGRSNNWLKLKNFKEIEIGFNKYERNNAGVKITDGFHEVQVQGIPRADWIVGKIDNAEVVKVIVQYLDKGESGKLRFPSCKEVVGYD